MGALPLASAYTAAMIGAASLVPPSCCQPVGRPRPFSGTESYTAAPVVGLASAATSFSVRRGHPVSFCQDGLASNREQPEPVAPLPEFALHAVSELRVYPLLLVPPTCSVVPPTVVT